MSCIKKLCGFVPLVSSVSKVDLSGDDDSFGDINSNIKIKKTYLDKRALLFCCILLSAPPKPGYSNSTTSPSIDMRNNISAQVNTESVYLANSQSSSNHKNDYASSSNPFIQSNVAIKIEDRGVYVCDRCGISDISKEGWSCKCPGKKPTVSAPIDGIVCKYTKGNIQYFEKLILAAIYHQAEQVNPEVARSIDWSKIQSIEELKTRLKREKSGLDSPTNTMQSQNNCISSALHGIKIIVDVDGTLVEPVSPFYAYSTYGLYSSSTNKDFNTLIASMIQKYYPEMAESCNEGGTLKKDFESFLHSGLCIKLPSRMTESGWNDLLLNLAESGVDLRIVSAVDSYYPPENRYQQLRDVGFDVDKLEKLLNAQATHASEIRDSNRVVQGRKCGILTHLNKDPNNPDKGNILSVFDNLQLLAEKQIIYIDDQHKNIVRMLGEFASKKAHAWACEYPVSTSKKAADSYDAHNSNQLSFMGDFLAKKNAERKIQQANEKVYNMVRNNPELKTWNDEEKQAFASESLRFWNIFLPDILNNYADKLKLRIGKISAAIIDPPSRESSEQSVGLLEYSKGKDTKGNNETGSTENKGSAGSSPTKDLSSIVRTVSNVMPYDNSSVDNVKQTIFDTGSAGSFTNLVGMDPESSGGPKDPNANTLAPTAVNSNDNSPHHSPNKLITSQEGDFHLASIGVPAIPSGFNQQNANDNSTYHSQQTDVQQIERNDDDDSDFESNIGSGIVKIYADNNQKRNSKLDNDDQGIQRNNSLSADHMRSTGNSDSPCAGLIVTPKHAATSSLGSTQNALIVDSSGKSGDSSRRASDSHQSKHEPNDNSREVNQSSDHVTNSAV